MLWFSLLFLGSLRQLLAEEMTKKFLIRFQHFPPASGLSLTHRGLSLTHRDLSLTHRGLSLTYRGLSLTHGGLSLTHRDLSLTHRELSPTHWLQHLPPAPSQLLPCYAIPGGVSAPACPLPRPGGQGHHTHSLHPSHYSTPLIALSTQIFFTHSLTFSHTAQPGILTQCQGCHRLFLYVRDPRIDEQSQKLLAATKQCPHLSLPSPCLLHPGQPHHQHLPPVSHSPTVHCVPLATCTTIPVFPSLPVFPCPTLCSSFFPLGACVPW